MIKNNIHSRLSRFALAAALTPLLMPVAVSCDSLEDDDHYGDSSTKIDNSELTIVKSTSEDYIKSRADLSSINSLFADNGIYKELEEKGQLSTILVVTNDNYTAPTGDTDDIVYATRSHVSDMSVSPANLHNGDRLMMWHGKYTNVTIDEQGQQGQIVDHISFNNGIVKEVVQTSNGYIYVISEMIETPTSLSDFINSLGDDYSIFKELVLSSGGKEFDKANSKPIGVSPDGNTLYDSVFIYTNAHFDNVNFDMNSESLTATMLLPSDDVINEAMNDAKARLRSWGLTRADSVLKNWILDVSFFNKRLTAADLSTPAQASEDPASKDINSIFSKQWRPGAHTLAAGEPIELSNGIVYPLTKLHIPTNVLIYRLKDWFFRYESCSDQEKADYYKMSNMVFGECKTDVAAWTPLAGVWPEIEDRSLILKVGDDGEGSPFYLDFTPVMSNEDGTISVYNVPPGSYRLAFGSKQNQNLTIRAHVLVNGNIIASSAGNIELGSSTTYHYDRGGSLNNRYPEGYDPAVVTALGGSKASNYDTDGGLLIEEVTIPDLKGDGSATPITIRIEADSWREQTSFTLAHWCLRPTVNNY